MNHTDQFIKVSSSFHEDSLVFEAEFISAKDAFGCLNLILLFLAFPLFS